MLKLYYEFKHMSASTSGNLANNNGDSGVSSEFGGGGGVVTGGGLYASTSSSCSSISLSNPQIANKQTGGDPTGKNNNQSTSQLTSLANVSIFENDEYFAYFYKLVQQFNFIDFNFKLFKDENNNNHTPKNTTGSKVSVDSTMKIEPPQLPASSTTIQYANISSVNTTSSSNASKISTGSSSNNRKLLKKEQQRSQLISQQQQQQPAPNHYSQFNPNNSNNNNNGFNLKNITKRLNIKSWFTSSSGSSGAVNDSNSPVAYSNSHSNTNLAQIIPKGQSGHRLNQNQNQSQNMPTNSKPLNSSKTPFNTKSGQAGTGGGILGSGVGTLVKNHNHHHHHHHLQNDTINNLMKHSLSEPSLNSIIN